MKIMKQYSARRCPGVCNKYDLRKPTIRLCFSNLWLNAAARDVLGDPDYVEIDYNEKSGIVTISPSTDANNYKVSKARSSGRSFSCSFLLDVLGIQQNEKTMLQPDGNRLIAKIRPKG